MAPTYTKTQLDGYYRHIGLPNNYRVASPTLNIDFLTSLHVHQISAVPYENLLLHYSASHTVSLDPQVLYGKIVTDARGRGGYCMELATFFNHVLRSLGFDAITVGVKIRPRFGGVPVGNYIGWVHVVNIVTLDDGARYVVDVGFGGDGPTKPMPLQSDRPSTFQGATNFQTQRVLVVLFLRGGEEIAGKAMLVDGEIKKNFWGKTETVEVCENEDQRVRALREHFGITLTEEERKGVYGRHVELRGIEG